VNELRKVAGRESTRRPMYRRRAMPRCLVIYRDGLPIPGQTLMETDVWSAPTAAEWRALH